MADYLIISLLTAAAGSWTPAQARDDLVQAVHGSDSPTSVTDEDFIASIFRVQFDQHLEPTLFTDVDPAAALTVDRCEATLRELRPGAVTVFALGHEGWARIFDTPFEPHPALSKDTLKIWREACDRTQTPLYVYVSSLINHRLSAAHPEFARQFSNGGRAGERLDHNSRYVDEYLLPFIDAIVTRYRPDGIWLDGDYWSIFPSWNAASTAAFERETGLKTPSDFGHENFSEFWRFTIDSHDRYVRRISELIQRRRPECTLVVNVGYTLRQPLAPPAFIGRVNIDPPLFFGTTTACLESRFQSSRPQVPCDVVLGDLAAPGGNPYTYPKSDVQLQQETATVLANGQRIKFYTTLDRRGRFDLERVRRLRRVLEEFCLPRKSVFQPSRSVPDIAVVHTRDHFRRTHRLDEVYGAALAALRSNRHFDIVDDETFQRSAGRYKVAILAEQGPLSDSLADALTRFVKAGGGLVLSLPTGVSMTGTLETSAAHARSAVIGTIGIIFSALLIGGVTLLIASRLTRRHLRVAASGIATSLVTAGVLSVCRIALAESGNVTAAMADNEPSVAQIQPAMRELLPVELLRRVDQPGRALSTFGPLGIESGWYIVEHDAENMTADLHVAAPSAPKPETPLRLRYGVGAGRVVAFTGPVFGTYGNGPDPRLRRLLAESIDLARSAPAPLVVTAPEWLEVSWRRTDDGDVIHFVNHARGAEFRARAPAVEHIPSITGVRVELATAHRPIGIVAIPKGQALPYEWQDGTLTIDLPRIHVHAAIRIIYGDD